MPMGTKYKYEVNKDTGRLALDRPLNQTVPANYGYIPDTLAADGDPEDVFVITETPLIPGCEVEVEMIGKFICTDGGVSDDKWVGVIKGDDVPKLEQENRRLSIEHYLRTYKAGFVVITWNVV